MNKITGWSRSGSNLMHTILFADSVYYGSSAANHGKQVWCIVESTASTASAYSIYVRHNGRANCLFGDGHVEALTKAELQSSAYKLVDLNNYVSVYP